MSRKKIIVQSPRSFPRKIEIFRRNENKKKKNMTYAPSHFSFFYCFFRFLLKKTKRSHEKRLVFILQQDIIPYICPAIRDL